MTKGIELPEWVNQHHNDCLVQMAIDNERKTEEEFNRRDASFENGVAVGLGIALVLIIIFAVRMA